ncbi:MAG: outer membrane protein transport protein [Candidatus Omnitrophica bacterium]|nr:outer membrane protein transport protein [Candidatus Omnitrophota bacterium]MDD5672016.1 outer membrane protein transport protein [Candidatus Omnitrophota bacterium]
MKKYLSALLSVLLIVSFPGTLLAVGSAGFENASYSAKSISQANAVVARPQDGSTIMINPAGLVELEGVQFDAGLQYLDWRIFHKDRATGDFNQNNPKLVLIPTFNVVMNPGELFDNRVALGLAVNSPFGISSSFPSIGMARYTGYKNDLKTIAATMAGAIKVTDWLDIGGGATHYWVTDYGQMYNYPNGFILGAPGTPDGKATVETSGHGWGWNTGILLKPLPHHKVGVSYRSRADIKVRGRLMIDDLVLGGLQGYDTFPYFETGAHSKLQFPSCLTMGYAYEPSSKWAAEFDIGLTNWQVFKNQNFTFDRPTPLLVALGSVPRDYQFTWNFHWGGHYQVTKKLDLLGGFYFYQAASPKEHVDNFIPDANRFGWTPGFSYQFNDHFNFDFNYLFVLFARRSISNPSVLAKTGESIDGRYTSIVNGVFVTLRYQFDFPFGKKKDEPNRAIQIPGIIEGTP